MTKRSYFALVLFLLFLLPSLIGQQASTPPRLILDPSVDPKKVDFQILRDIFRRVSQQSGGIRHTEYVLKTGRFAHATGDSNVISMGYPVHPNDPADPAYHAFGHEVGHSLQPDFGTAQIQEGMAEAKAYFALSKRAYTSVFIGELVANLPLGVVGGDFQKSWFSYREASAPFEAMSKNPDVLRLIEQELARTMAQNVNYGSYEEYQALVLEAVNRAVDFKIHGLSAKTLLAMAPTGRVGPKGTPGMPDGAYLGLMPVGHRPANADFRSHSPINPDSVFVIFLTRKGWEITNNTGVSTGVVDWHISEASGKVLFQGSYTIAGPENFVIPLPEDLSKLPNGGYNMKTVVRGTKTTAWAPIVRYNGDWLEGKAFVIKNGPGHQFESLNNEILLSKQGHVVENFPGLSVVSGVKPSEDVTLVDPQGREFVFTAHPYFSSVHYLNRRSEPRLDAVLNGASFKEGPVTRGSWVSLFGWKLSHSDPMAPASVPFPTASVDNATKVLWKDSFGRQVFAPISYTSTGQVNCQVPQELAGERAWISVFHHGVASNEISVELTEAVPAVFAFNWPGVGQLPAAVSEHGYLITPQSPLLKQSGDGDTKPSGEVVTVYLQGLGPTNPPPEKDGHPAKFVLAHAIAPVRVTVDGVDCPVLFAGLSPGSVGLFQVNFRVPAEVKAGNPTLVVWAGDHPSNATKLAVR